MQQSSAAAYWLPRHPVQPCSANHSSHEAQCKRTDRTTFSELQNNAMTHQVSSIPGHVYCVCRSGHSHMVPFQQQVLAGEAVCSMLLQQKTHLAKSAMFCIRKSWTFGIHTMLLLATSSSNCSPIIAASLSPDLCYTQPSLNQQVPQEV